MKRDRSGHHASDDGAGRRCTSTLLPEWMTTAASSFSPCAEATVLAAARASCLGALTIRRYWQKQNRWGRAPTHPVLRRRKSHATCREAIRLWHSAGCGSAVRALRSLDDEYFSGREQPPAWLDTRKSRRHAGGR